MAGTTGKVAAESFKYSITETITVEVKMTRDLVPMGSLDTMYFWSWTIFVEGKVRFKGADLITDHNVPTEAAVDVLYNYCPRAATVPDWFQGEANASQKNWFKITAPRMAPVLERITKIGMYPGAQLITDDGLVPFDKNGIPVNTIIHDPQSSDDVIQDYWNDNVAPVVEGPAYVVMGELSEGTRAAIEARENRTEGSGNVAASTPTLPMSPFSNV